MADTENDDFHFAVNNKSIKIINIENSTKSEIKTLKSLNEPTNVEKLKEIGANLGLAGSIATDRLTNYVRGLTEKARKQLEDSKALDEAEKSSSTNIEQVLKDLENTSREIEAMSKSIKVPIASTLNKSDLDNNNVVLDNDNNSDTPTKKPSAARDSETNKYIKVQAEPKKIPREKLKTLKSEIVKELFGQDDIVEKIADQLKISGINLRIEDNKPQGAFLCPGPSGVGKTELWKIVARILDIPLIRFDMSEYTTEIDIKKLIGVAPGYVGYEQGGQLTNAVLENPTCIVLFDEIEKADPAISKIFLQMLDNAMLTDNHGNKVSFKNAIVVGTSNLGSEVEYVGGLTKEQKDEYRMEAIKERILPEVINRFDNIFHFNALEKPVYAIVFKKFMNLLINKVKESQNIVLTYSDQLIEFAVEKSYDRAMGGRPARRFNEQVILSGIIDKIYDNALGGIKEINIDLNESGLIIFKKPDGTIISTVENTKKLIEAFEAAKFTKNPPPPFEPTVTGLLDGIDNQGNLKDNSHTIETIDMGAKRIEANNSAENSENILTKKPNIGRKKQTKSAFTFKN